VINRVKKKPPLPKNFPCEHTFTIMGNNQPDFPKTVVNILKINEIDVKEKHVKQKISAKKTYISLTIIVEIQNQNQLDNIYQALHNSHLIKYLL
jgi:uncharacterized protein